MTEAPNISEDAVQLMKFHGSYMQVWVLGPGHWAFGHSLPQLGPSCTH